MSGAADAERRAGRLYSSPGFRRAYVRGALAADEGRPIEACPYYPRGSSGRGWAAWRRAWRAGWLSVRTSDPE